MTRLTQRHDTRLPTFLIAVGATLPLAAEAYVGPGAGLSLLTALWGIIAAIGMALFFVIMWPIRRMRRRRKAEAAAAAEGQTTAQASTHQASTGQASTDQASTTQTRTAQDPESPPSTARVEETQRAPSHVDHRS